MLKDVQSNPLDLHFRDGNESYYNKENGMEGFYDLEFMHSELIDEVKLIHNPWIFQVIKNCEADCLRSRKRSSSPVFRILLNKKHQQK